MKISLLFYYLQENSSDQGAPKEEVQIGSNPPQEPEAEENEGEHVPRSRPVTPDESDSEKENNRPKRRVNIQGQNEENERGTKIRGHVNLEVNVNGDADISVTLNINKCPIQNLRVRRCHYFMQDLILLEVVSTQIALLQGRFGST